MLCKSIILFFLFCITCILGARFKPNTLRFDYEYNQEVNGWFKFHAVPQQWSVARLNCHAEGAVLASPLTNEIRKAIVNHATKYSSVSYIFSGVHSSFAKGVYTSVEGIPLSRLSINWAPGEPNNFDNSEDCLIMSIRDNGTMKDDVCWKVLPYVCYKEKVNDIGEQVMLNECGTIDKEYSLKVETGKCYKFHRRGQIWSKAYMTCIAEGGHLAIINCEEEAAILGKLFSSIKDSEIFSKNPHIASIGFRDWRDEGSWMTIHGQTLPEAGFNRWWQNEPDNNTRAPNFSSELCGSIVRAGVLNDVACDLQLPFICEKELESLVNLEDTNIF